MLFKDFLATKNCGFLIIFFKGHPVRTFSNCFYEFLLPPFKGHLHKNRKIFKNIICVKKFYIFFKTFQVNKKRHFLRNLEFLCYLRAFWPSRKSLNNTKMENFLKKLYFQGFPRRTFSKLFYEILKTPFQ